MIAIAKTNLGEMKVEVRDGRDKAKIERTLFNIKNAKELSTHIANLCRFQNKKGGK